MNKNFLKKAISNLILLFLVILFVVGFSNTFGESNILIGVMTITAFFMAMPYNLSVHPIKNFSKILLINLLMGICATLALINPFIGIIVNFLMVYVIIISFYYSFRMELYFPFLLQYAFILFFPIDFNLHDIVLRLLSLCVAPIIIIGSQILMHKNFAHKRILNLINIICELQKDFNSDGDNFFNQVENFKLALFDYKPKVDVNGIDNVVILNIIEVLEKIYWEKEEIDELDKKLLLEYLDELKEAIKHQSVVGNYKFNNQQLNQCVIIINNNLAINTNTTLKEKVYNLVKDFDKIRISLICKKERYNVERQFAIKVGVAFSVITFIVDFFKIPEGKWAVFTVVSVLTPLLEKSSQKISQRFFATIIGLVVVSLLFYFIKSPILRSISILLVNYIHMFQTQYKYKIILVTISAVGTVMISAPDTFNIDISLLRLSLIALGLFIGIMLNRLLFPYSLEKSINIDVKRVSIILKEIVCDIKCLINQGVIDDKITSKVLIPSLIKNNITNNILSCSSNLINPINNDYLKTTNNLYYIYMLLLYKVEINKDKVLNYINKIERELNKEV